MRQMFVDAHLKLRKFTPPVMKQFELKIDDIGKRLSDITDNSHFPAIATDIQNVIDAVEMLQKEIH